MLSFYQTPERISSFSCKNSWLFWKTDLYFQRSCNDMWDTRQQEKLIDNRVRDRSQSEFRIGDSIHKPRGKRNPVRVWLFTAEIIWNIGQHSLYLESITVIEKRNRKIHRQLKAALSHRHILHGNSRTFPLKLLQRNKDVHLYLPAAET